MATTLETRVLLKEHNFPVLVNDSIIKAVKGEDVDRIPVWIMRQAGRYLPEFKEMRAKHEFFEICYNPELACEVTMLPIRKFDLDAAIIFSDILVIPQALGMDVKMVPGKGPTFTEPLQKPSDISTLQPANVDKILHHVYDAITLARHTLAGKVPLIGFTGGPWTLMSYMIEGGGSTTISNAKRWLYKHPQASHELLTMLKNVAIEHLVKQALAGAQLLMVFESHAGILSPQLYCDYLVPYCNEIASSVKERLQNIGHEAVPMIFFPKDAHFALDLHSENDYDVIGLDWTIDPELARSKITTKSLQGNLDPCALYAPRDDLKLMTERMISKFGRKNYIANLGHGIYPDMDPDAVKYFIDVVHSI